MTKRRTGLLIHDAVVLASEPVVVEAEREAPQVHGVGSGPGAEVVLAGDVAGRSAVDPRAEHETLPAPGVFRGAHLSHQGEVADGARQEDVVPAAEVERWNANVGCDSSMLSRFQ